MTHHQMAFKRPAALAKIERVLALLAERPRTAHELAEAIPMSKRHAQDYINHLHETGRVYIVRWVRHVEHSGRMYPRPVYQLQNLKIVKDRPKPPPLTPEQRKRRAWELVKADPERHTTHLLKKRRYRTDKKGPRTDIAAAWIAPANDEMRIAA